MSRWSASGYAVSGLFPGVWACRFRLCHVRDDGLVVLTVGDQRDRGGRLSPVHQGFHFMTLIGRVPERGDADVDRITLHTTAQEAEAHHPLALVEWEDIEA